MSDLLFESAYYQETTFENKVCRNQAFRSKEFENCTFRNIDFSETTFAHCRFIDCTFFLSNLSLVKWNHSILNNAKFETSKLMGIIFSDCSDSFFDVGFSDCVLDYCSFADKKMLKTTFKQCSMKDTNFAGTILNASVFHECDLNGAHFNRTQLLQTDLRTALHYQIDPELNNIRKAKFSLAGLPGLLTKHDIHIT